LITLDIVVVPQICSWLEHCINIYFPVNAKYYITTVLM